MGLPRNDGLQSILLDTIQHVVDLPRKWDSHASLGNGFSIVVTIAIAVVAHDRLAVRVSSLNGSDVVAGASSAAAVVVVVYNSHLVCLSLLFRKVPNTASCVRCYLGVSFDL